MPGFRFLLSKLSIFSAASQAIREELGETAMILILREPEAWNQGARDQQQHRGQAEGQV